MHGQEPPLPLQMSLRAILLLLLLAGGARCDISLSDTHISATRNSYRTQICSYYSASYSNSEIQSAQKYLNQYSYLSTAQIEAILFNQDFGVAFSNTILLAAPHIVTLAVALVLWIPLLCCCVRPEKHPTCRKCRKPEKENYKSCELKWTAYLTVLFYLVVAAGGVLAVLQGPDIVLYFNDIGCKMTAVADDIVNGRLSPSVSTRFFTGLSPFSTDLGTLIGSFNTIWTQSQNSLSNAGNVRTNQTFYQMQVNSTYSSFSNPSYSNAFSSDGSISNYQTVSSAFKTLFYGPTTNSSTILGNIYSSSSVIFNEINAVLDPMITAWSHLSAATEAGVLSQMTATLSSSSTLQANLSNFMTKIGSFFSNQTTYKQLVLVLKAFYGCFFGLALLGTLAAILLAFFSVVRIRLIMYFTCGIMYFLSLLSFVLLIFLALLGPNLSQVCSYMETKFATGAGTQDFFAKMGWSQFGQLTSQCMGDGSGWMMNDIESTFNVSYADLVVITQGAQLLNDLIPHYSTANLLAPFTTGTATVNSVLNAQLLEVTDTVATNFIQGVRLVSYPLVTCTNPTNVNADSWMPSYTLYTCPSGKAQNNPCGNLGSTATCPNGCFQIMNELESAAGDTSYSTTLQTRYGATCNYYTFIKNLELNWNVPRKASMNAVLGSLSTLQADVTSYDNSFKGVQANLTTFATILQTNFNGITNLTSGTFSGMDCRVIGESIADFQKAVCVGFLSSVYYNFVVLLLLSYGSLMVACCGTCAGVRHFKHIQRMKISTGYKGVPVAISEQRIFDSDK